MPLPPPSRRDPPHARGFDFTLHMRRVCEDMIARLEELRYIDLPRVSVGFSQTRSAVPHGLYASLTPMRFSGGKLETVRRGRRYAIQRLFDRSGREMLYILRFYLPRFFDLSFRQKLTTVVHELWHIGPAFDGDLRRHRGRCYAHGASRKAYDAHAESLVDRWLARSPPAELYEFLQQPFDGLLERHGRVFGTKVPGPKLIPVDS